MVLSKLFVDRLRHFGDGVGITCEANLDLLVCLAGLCDLALVVVLVQEAARLEGALVLTGLGDLSGVATVPVFAFPLPLCIMSLCN